MAEGVENVLRKFCPEGPYVRYMRRVVIPWAICSTPVVKSRCEKYAGKYWTLLTSFVDFDTGKVGTSKMLRGILAFRIRAINMSSLYFYNQVAMIHRSGP